MAREHGRPGSGLESAGHFGGNEKIGAAGERYFAESLRKSGALHRYEAWYSLRIPSPSGKRRFRGDPDVDMAIASGNKIVLVDVKKWASGHHYWSLFGNYPFRGLTPMRKESGDWSMSANMKLAVERYRQALPGVTVSGLVVFVPTSKTGKLPASVAFLMWPGGIRSYLTSDAIYEITRRLGPTGMSIKPEIRTLLGSLRKDKDDQAPEESEAY